jgi:hypothetical protein
MSDLKLRPLKLDATGRPEWFRVVGSDGVCITQSSDPEWGAYIVRACNSFDGLVAALEDLLRAGEEAVEFFGQIGEAHKGYETWESGKQQAERILAALAAAKAKP